MARGHIYVCAFDIVHDSTDLEPAKNVIHVACSSERRRSVVSASKSVQGLRLRAFAVYQRYK